MPQRTYTIGENVVAVDPAGPTLSIPPDPRNADYQRALVDLGRTHDDVLAEVQAARAARKTADDTATNLRRGRERNARTAVKLWLAGSGPAPTLRQLADALGSVGDDGP